MSRLLMLLGLPLLTKELIEQSARARTWVVRSLYLGLLFLVFMLSASSFWDARNVRSMLGSGGQLFDMLVGLQFFGVYVITPLASFGLITSEKERDSLQLLLLTRLGPWTILLEKLLSRLVPLSLFLLAALPLMSVAYSYGGVSTPMLANAVLCLMCTAFFLACIALMMSTYAITSTSAFFGTLAVGAMFILGPPIMALLIDEVFHWRINFLTFLDEEDLFVLMGPVVFYDDVNKNFFSCFLRNLPQLGVGVLCLSVARVCLPLRAFAGKSSAPRRLRALVDRVLSKFRSTQPRRDLPDENPVTWVERRQGMSGRKTYLAILFVFVATALLFGAILAGMENDLDKFAAICHGFLWMIAPLVVCGKAAGLFGTERSRQTLDVLLTTPLTSREIVRQKMAGTWSLMGFLLLLFVLLAVMNSIGAMQHSHRTQPIPLAFLSSIVTPAVYLPMFAWLSVAISLRTKTAARATVYSVIAVVVWCFGPMFFCTMCMVTSNTRGFGNDEAFFAVVFPLLSPAFFAAMSVASFVDDDLLEDYFIISLIWNTMIYSGALLVIRGYSLNNASDALDRPENV